MTHIQLLPFLAHLQDRTEIPLSETGVSHRFSTCSLCKCSEIINRPASPNWNQINAIHYTSPPWTVKIVLKSQSNKKYACVQINQTVKAMWYW